MAASSPKDVLRDSPEVLARVKDGLDLTDALARQMHRHFGPFLAIEDLAAHGREALLAAARSYDAARGLPFHRWAYLRIRGAMIDAMRQNGTLPKRVYRKLRALKAADLVYESAAEDAAGVPVLSPEAADEQLSIELGTAAMAMALGFLLGPEPEALDEAEDPDRSPESQVGRAELLDRIRRALASRPEQERRLIERYYFDDVTFEEAARELGLSKSWASRLHSRAIEEIARSMRRSRVCG